MITHPTTHARVQTRLSREEDGSGREQELLGAVRKHASVMTAEVLRYLEPKAGEVVVDATAGAGGHSEALLKAAKVTLIAFDADKDAVQSVQQRLAPFGAHAQVVEANFADLAKQLKKLGVEEINKALFDLGWNMGQLASGRGFSFLHDEPLNMSYGAEPASGFTAAEVVNEWSEAVLADVLYGYGEETYARRIAKAIVERRKMQPIATTLELSEIIKDAVPAAYRRGRLHPATRSFQALRMAVNAELPSIEAGVTAAWERLAVGGRIAVITFHSIEDRAVKRLFVSFAKGGGGTLILKKPLAPSQEEIRKNPSARSAKLRVIEKTA